MTGFVTYMMTHFQRVKRKELALETVKIQNGPARIMTEKKNKSKNADSAHGSQLKDDAKDRIGCQILRSAQNLHDAWRRENPVAVLDRSAETVQSILAGLKMLEVGPDRQFSR